MLLKPDDLAARRDMIDESPTLGEVARRLRRQLDPLLDGPLYLPGEKALLSRGGGVCPEDGSRLAFDPLSPERHACPRCSRSFSGERHHRAWIWRYHLWLSERAIHMALLAHLLDERALAERAAEIVRAYAALYPTVPNRDNVLGPTRLFFSTYLESLWLLQLTLAASLLEAAGHGSVRTALEPVVQESAGLIGSFDETWSNRQVWNNAALLAAGRWLGEDELVARGLDGPHGIRAQLGQAVTRDGLWFEGENYHFFALRGLLLAAEVLRGAGVDLYAEPGSGERLAAMYVAPLDTAFPDLTLPARGDAPFGVSLLQPRFAELWEVGRARLSNDRIDAVLTAMYDADLPLGEDDGFSEIAEQEQHRPAARLSRDRLGWKALLWMRPEQPRGERSGTQPSALLEDAGVAVLRGGGAGYVSLECGGRPGGHGHPDLLHLSLHAGASALADFGTGSYVSPSLHWYRSTVAHNAPGVSEVGQVRRDGWCAAFDSKGAWSWCRGAARELLGEGSTALRTVVIGPEFLVDVVDVQTADGVLVDLPLHPLGGIAWPADMPRIPLTATSHPAPPRARPREGAVDTVLLGSECLELPLDGSSMELFLPRRRDEGILAATGPGPPSLDFADGAPLEFLVRRARGSGRWVQVIALRAGAVKAVTCEKDRVTVRLTVGGEETLTLSSKECRITDRAGSTHVLRGLRKRRSVPAPSPQPHGPVVECPVLDRMPLPEEWLALVPPAAVHRLGAANYRRSEEPHGAAGPFTAQVAVFVVGSKLCFAADVVKRDVTLRASDAADPGLDNEPADIHSDGVQCYVGRRSWTGYLCVPDPDSSRVRVQPAAGSAISTLACAGRWSRTRDGYSVVVSVDSGPRIKRGERFPVSFVINEAHPGRERRAGQLVLGGGSGWVYLRGDREYAAGAPVAEVV
jgi:hypothetical protein